MLDSRAIILNQLPINKLNAKVRHVFQMRSAEIKQDWVLDFRAVRLALGKLWVLYKVSL